MDKKDLMPQVAQLVNRITTGEMPNVLAELEELDEEGLSQVWGGAKPKFKPPNLPPGKPPTVAGTRR
jgi:bacteriocin leader peptide (microcyclamide/patellamide family)